MSGHEKRIWVTGAAGMLGTALCPSLVKQGFQVSKTDLRPEDKATRPLDVSNYDEVWRSVQQTRPDVVIHLAAIRNPLFTTPDVTFRVNVLGTFNVHEAAWKLGIHRVVSTGSGAVLGFIYRDRDLLPEYLPIDEDHPNRLCAVCRAVASRNQNNPGAWDCR